LRVRIKASAIAMMRRSPAGMRGGARRQLLSTLPFARKMEDMSMLHRW